MSTTNLCTDQANHALLWICLQVLTPKSSHARPVNGDKQWKQSNNRTNATKKELNYVKYGSANLHLWIWLNNLSSSL